MFGSGCCATLPGTRCDTTAVRIYYRYLHYAHHTRIYAVPVRTYTTYSARVLVMYQYWYCCTRGRLPGIGMHYSKGVFGTVPVFSVPVWMSYRTYRSVRYRYCRTELTEVSGTGIDVPNLLKCPIPVLMSYRTYPSVRYRY